MPCFFWQSAVAGCGTHGNFMRARWKRLLPQRFAAPTIALCSARRCFDDLRQRRLLPLRLLLTTVEDLANRVPRANPRSTQVPTGVEALILVNIHSYGGGRSMSFLSTNAWRATLTVVLASERPAPPARIAATGCRLIDHALLLAPHTSFSLPPAFTGRPCCPFAPHTSLFPFPFTFLLSARLRSLQTLSSGSHRYLGPRVHRG